MNALHFSSVQETVNYMRSKSSKGFILFSSTENVAELSKVVGDNVVLCSTAGEYTPQGYKTESITGFEYELSEADIVEILYPPVKSIEKLRSSYQKVSSNKNAFLLLLCNGLSGMEESIITSLYFIDDNFKIIGGSSGDYLKFQETPIYIGNRKVHSVAVFFNSKQRTQIIKENIYIPTGKRLLITESDPINRVVRTFNNNPASTEYANALGIKESELPNYFMNNPLGKLYKDDVFIASPMKVNSDKSITFYCQLMPSTFVEVLTAVNPVGKIKNTLESTKIRPSFVLAINCVLRSLKFQQDGIWKDIDREMIGFCKNSTGFISYGEQFYKHHANQTMVMLLAE